MKIQSYPTTAASNLKRLAAAILANLFALWPGRAARKRQLRTHRVHTLQVGRRDTAI